MSGVERLPQIQCGRVLVQHLRPPRAAGGAVPGTTAVLIAGAAGGGPTAEDWARAAGTIGYEIVTRLGPRVPRVHIDSEEPS